MDKRNFEILDREGNMLDSKAAAEITQKILNLKVALDRDLLACDAKWTLFVSAALSYRYDCQLKPFPPKFMTEEGLNIEALINIINDVPPLQIFLNNILEGYYIDLEIDVIELLHWVLIEERDPTLRTLSEREYQLVFDSLFQSADTPKPTQVFEVIPAPRSKYERRFALKQGKYETGIGFHGNKLTNFYSILHYGIKPDMCENGPLGDGIYLSTDISVSMKYSPKSPAWGASLCGSIISCAAICEYINNSRYTDIIVKTCWETEEKQTCVVVAHSDACRVRYLVFYGDNIGEEFCPRQLAISWFNRNKYIVTICLYTLIISSLAIACSGNGMDILKNIINIPSALIDLVKNIFS